MPHPYKNPANDMSHAKDDKDKGTMRDDINHAYKEVKGLCPTCGQKYGGSGAVGGAAGGGG